MIQKSLGASFDYIKKDWEQHPLRLALETVNWLCNAAIGLIIAFTVPNAPFLILYPIWFVCLAISIYSAASRGSFGLLMAAATMAIIDICGYIRLLTQ